MYFFILLFVIACFCSTPAASAETETLRLADGTALDLIFRCPKQKRHGRIPVVFLFGGFETGAKAIDLVDPRAEMCLATFQYPFTGPRRLPLPQALGYLPKARTAIHHTIEGQQAMLRWAESHPSIDSKRIILVGASFGAPFVTVTAGNNPAVKALILVHGFADVPQVVAHRLAEKWRPKYGSAGAWFAKLLADFLWWYAGVPAPEAGIARMQPHQKVLLLHARDDDLVPPQGVDALRAAFVKSSVKWEEKSLPGAHLRPGETKMIADLLAESLRWLRHEKLISP